MDLYQIFCELSRLGYDRYSLEGDLLGTDVICSLFMPNMETPDIVVIASYGLQALRIAVRRARDGRIIS